MILLEVIDADEFEFFGKRLPSFSLSAKGEKTKAKEILNEFRRSQEFVIVVPVSASGKLHSKTLKSGAKEKRISSFSLTASATIQRLLHAMETLLEIDIF